MKKESSYDFLRDCQKWKDEILVFI